MPIVATDFNKVEKFLKLPNNAIPDEPKKTETILEENIPKTKLNTTEIELSESTFSNVFCFRIFNL